MSKLTSISGFVLLAVVMLAPSLRAQRTDLPSDETRQQPEAPYPAYVPAGNQLDPTTDAAQNRISDIPVRAEDHPLSSIQDPTLSMGVGARNFLIPSISVLSQIGTTSVGWQFTRPTVSSYFLGSLDLSHVSDRSQLLLHYSGGGVVSSYTKSAISDLSFSYGYDWQRWTMLVAGQATFLSESSFGFGGIGGLAFLNGDFQIVPFLSGSLSANQTIPTIMVPRLGSTGATQIEYKLSQRSSWTASVGGEMLNFLGAGYINSVEGQFQTGYNRQLSPQSSFAVIYRFDAFRYTYLNETIEDHVAQLGYGHYLTGRLNFFVAAGPSQQFLRGTLTGPTGRLSWAADSSLNYQLDRTTLLLSFHHLVSGGSGVLIGAQTSQVEGTIERLMTSRWHATVSVGYARNESLVPTINPENGAYNSWYTAVRFTRQLRPESSFFLGYGARLQTVATVGCVSLNCGSHAIGHDISAGFNFALRPVVFR